MVAVEDFIDVGNILNKAWVALSEKLCFVFRQECFGMADQIDRFDLFTSGQKDEMGI